MYDMTFLLKILLINNQRPAVMILVKNDSRCVFR